MEWNELSNEAKNIVEWIENPYTNKRTTIKIKVGEYFQPETYTLNRRTPTKVLITKEIYQEIIKYVTASKELQCKQFTDSFIFKIKDDSKLTLH